MGVAAPEPGGTVNNTQVNVGKVSVNTELSALEAARRLAFALEKTARAHPLLEAAAADQARYARDEESKGKPTRAPGWIVNSTAGR